MNIKTRLIASFSVVIIIIAVAGGLSVFEINKLVEANSLVSDTYAPAMTASVKMRSNLLEGRLLMDSILVEEESLSSKTSVIRSFTDSQDLISYLLNGGEDEDGTRYAPVEEENIRELLAEMKGEDQIIIDVTERYFEFFKTNWVRSPELDREFVIAFRKFHDHTTDLEKLLEVQLHSATSGAKQAAHTSRIIMLSIAGLALVVALITALSLIRLIARGFGAIIESARIIALGDFSRSVEIRGNNEFTELGRSFNNFTSEISLILTQVKDVTRKLAETGMDLSTNMEETSSAINQITATIESIKARTTDQVTSVIQSSSSIEEIVQNIESLNQLIENQAASVTQSSASIEEMIANINSVTNNVSRMEQNFDLLYESVNKGSTVLQQTDGFVKEVEEQSAALLDTNKVIAGIAAQTNLLAMNAAIEAAHAGEYGRGFAVVADEIRKLAEDASVKSKSVDELLKRVKEIIDSVVSSSAESRKSFDDVRQKIETVAQLEREIKNSMDEQSAGSTQVLEALHEIHDITAEVKNGSSEMKEGSRVILTEMNKVKQISDEVNNSITEMAAGAEEANGAVIHVAEITENNRELVGNLSNEVDRFTLQGNVSAGNALSEEQEIEEIEVVDE